jgi:hypothetical protein
MMDSDVMWRRNFPVFVNFPRHRPRERRFSRATDVARLAREERT